MARCCGFGGEGGKGAMCYVNVFALQQTRGVKGHGSPQEFFEIKCSEITSGEFLRQILHMCKLGESGGMLLHFLSCSIVFNL